VEYQLKEYGQAWSTSKVVAEAFAYQNYEGQPWFYEGNRLVLQANIYRSHLFYSQQSGEFEVAVNTECLLNVEICT